MTTISRRNVLKLASSVLTAAALSPSLSPWSALHTALAGDSSAPPLPLGRVAEWTADIRTEPTKKSKLVRTARRDEVLRLVAQVSGQAVMSYNPTWFQTDEGYAYSSWIQPVQDVQSPAEPDQAGQHFWGEIATPFADARVNPDPQGRRAVRLYYGTVYRAVAAAQDKQKQWWYRLKEGVSFSAGPWIPAASLRRIDPSELTPLSPDVTDKRIEVSLKAQRITAYENGQPVLTSLVCSGTSGFGTPRGTHHVLFKTPTSRMIGGSGPSYYDLPGVPFPTFLTWRGVAIHGTYWHNDFGRPRSHGCLNVPSEVAKWFWRWTLPSAPYDRAVYYTPRGADATVVVIA